MSDRLKEVWQTTGGAPTPNSAGKVDAVFDTERAGLNAKIAAVLSAGTTARGTLAAPVFNELQELADAVGEETARILTLENQKPAPAAPAELVRLRRQLERFGDELRLWRMFVINAASAGVENARTRFADAGNWALHYSTVRMTIATFFVGISWGIISLKWSSYSEPLRNAAIGVWTLAGAFLILFTALTHRAANRQEIYKQLLPTAGSSAGGRSRADKFLAGFLIWLPVVVYAAVSVGFAALLQGWARQLPQPTITWTVQAQPVDATPIPLSTTVGGAEIKLVSARNAQAVPDLTEVTAQLNQIQRSLAEIASTLRALSTDRPSPPASRAVPAP